MPIVRCDNYIDVYRQKAKAGDIHELSGRTNRPDLTSFVAREILARLRLGKTDTIVDVGCGDGTLLTLAASSVQCAIGVLPTSEEVDRLRKHFGDEWPMLNIREGTAGNTGLESASVDVIVCNGVLLLLESSAVDDALDEFARIGKPGGQVFLGEIPLVDEFADRPYGDSIWRWLYFVFRRRGGIAFLRSLTQLIRAACTSEPFVILPKSLFYETEERFVARAARHGLILKQSMRHRQLSEDHAEGDSPTRQDYLFEAKG